MERKAHAENEALLDLLALLALLVLLVLTEQMAETGYPPVQR